LARLKVSTFLAVRLLTIAAPSIRARGGSFLDCAIAAFTGFRLRIARRRGRTPNIPMRITMRVSEKNARMFLRTVDGCLDTRKHGNHERAVILLTHSWRNLHAIVMLAHLLQN